ncbi:MAG: chromosomal replication initiator protein DnaA [Lachnoclostridium sp.]|nr:chromosomal replication initiator protein DnaA [Lachnoclostridium sp.]
MYNDNSRNKWEDCLRFIGDNLPAEQYDAWFKPLTFHKLEDGKLVINIPSPYFYEQLEERYVNLISIAINKVYGPGTQLFYHYNQINNEPSTAITMATANPSTAVRPAAGASSNPFRQNEVEDIDSQLNPSYNFENYCTSPSNKVAVSIGEAIADNPKLKTFNPLFVCGPCGVGKTHLIQAIGVRIKEHNPQARVLYITSRLFQSQYTSAEHRGKINEFINFYQSIDVLIIDDIQDLIGKTKTQNTFFHIFNHLKQNQKQLILSSDCPPALMKGMEERLLSRFKGGTTVMIEKPDYSLRKEVLNLRASQDGLDIPQEVMEFIASNVTDSIRELEGIVVSLLAHATFMNREITVSLARSVLSNAVKISKRTLNFEDITRHVSDFFNINPDQIFTKSRKREISDARQMVMYLVKKHTKMPLKAIGARLSRTHATVLYACNAIEQRIPLDHQLQDDIAAIEKAMLS